MSKSENPKIIAKTISLNRQSVLYSETLDLAGTKLKIDIKSDSYDFQSRATVGIYSKAMEAWNNLASIPYATMKTEPMLCFLPNQGGLAEKNFIADRNELLRQAIAIIS